MRLQLMLKKWILYSMQTIREKISHKMNKQSMKKKNTAFCLKKRPVVKQNIENGCHIKKKQQQQLSHMKLVRLFFSLCCAFISIINTSFYSQFQSDCCINAAEMNP